MSIAKAGTRISVDEGEYSDTIVYGTYSVLKDFDPMEELAKYLDAHPEQRGEYRFAPDDFLHELVAAGYLAYVKTDGHLHLGSYCNADRAFFS